MSRRRDSTEADYTKASPVIIRRVDGSVSIEEALTPAEMRRVVRTGQAAPRAWREPYSRHAGGADFKT